MNRCPISYELCGNEKYAVAGLQKLAPSPDTLNDFPYNKDEQLREAIARASKISIQGVQPKLSAKLTNKKVFLKSLILVANTFLNPKTIRT